mmetsp:Transcript_28664/g.70982  ORF Transcript_28664/g.70982 Transcript_28664/m.70982 type:complete len:256 (+) Transcript_28664:90-857(+)
MAPPQGIGTTAHTHPPPTELAPARPGRNQQALREQAQPIHCPPPHNPTPITRPPTRASSTTTKKQKKAPAQPALCTKKIPTPPRSKQCCSLALRHGVLGDGEALDGGAHLPPRREKALVLPILLDRGRDLHRALDALVVAQRVREPHAVGLHARAERVLQLLAERVLLLREPGQQLHLRPALQLTCRLLQPRQLALLERVLELVERCVEASLHHDILGFDEARELLEHLVRHDLSVLPGEPLVEGVRLDPLPRKL